MTKHKIQNKHKAQIPNTKTLVLIFVIWILNLFCALNFDICHLQFGILNSSFAQQSDDLELTLDITQDTIPLPKIFKPNIDLSGRGFHREATWPQAVAAKEVLDRWQKDIGFGGLYRLQFNLWDINQFSKDKDSQNKLLSNYESIIKNITDAGGIVILDIFGTPAGLGKVLDKKSPPRDLRAFKELIKSTIRDLSCNKRYNIWYEVWNAPDLDDFFLGRKQEYLNLYRAVAESINELKAETKIHIPLGGPSVSWWFHNLDSNTIATPEKSLIYELIKFCNHHRLPLDFITWHGYSTNPGAEKENTIYKKTPVELIRDWLTYFNFDRNIPLIVDEWNYDRNANVLPERKENSFICASFIPSRIKKMYGAGIDYQLYFCLEDFQNNKEGVVRNVGIFSFAPEHIEYKGEPKAIYNVFRMLTNLGNDMFLSKFDDEFVGVIVTKVQEQIVLLVYNYIDPDIVMNYLSKNIANLNKAERKVLLNIITSDKLEKIMLRQLDIATLHTSNKVKTVLKKAQELNDKAKKFEANPRNIKIGIKNLRPIRSKSLGATALPAAGTSNGVKPTRDKSPETTASGASSGVQENYLYQRYTVDSSCSLNCEFAPTEEKEISAVETYQEVLTLKPYSVHMIILKKKPKEAESTQTKDVTQTAQDTSKPEEAPSKVKKE